MTLTLRHGRALMEHSELELLAHTVANTDGDHLEIGSMWGGTAIVAASAKEQAGSDGKVVCIDPFTERDNGDQPTAALFWENIDDAGFHDRVELHVCPSAPWPLPATRRFGSVLIDGNHKAPWPETDWESARCVTDLILLHDVNWHEPDIVKLHARVINEAESWADGSRWQVRESAKFLYVYERVTA